MIIISVNKLKNFKARYSIKTDNGLYFNISERLLKQEKINIDKTISENILNKITNDELNYLRYYSNRYFQKFISSENKFREKLFLKGFSKKNINKILSENIESGFIDDDKYSKYLIVNLINKRKYSKREIIQKLYIKKVPKNMIDNLINKYYTDEIENETKSNIITKKKSKLNDKQLRMYLYRKGFCSP